MATGNIKLINRVVTALSGLLVAAIVGGVMMYRSVGIAEDNIDDLEKDQLAQTILVQQSLGKIDTKLDEIKEAISQQRVEAAKFHHEHQR